MSHICIALGRIIKKLSTNKISYEPLSHPEAERVGILIYMHIVENLRSLVAALEPHTVNIKILIEVWWLLDSAHLLSQLTPQKEDVIYIFVTHNMQVPSGSICSESQK